MQSHAFHLAFTTVIGLAAYQAVIALARNSEDFDTWDGVLMTGANVALLFPVLAIPMIFGGLRSRRLRDLSPVIEVNLCSPTSHHHAKCLLLKRHLVRNFLDSFITRFPIQRIKLQHALKGSPPP